MILRRNARVECGRLVSFRTLRWKTQCTLFAGMQMHVSLVEIRKLITINNKLTIEIFCTRALKAGIVPYVQHL